MDFFGGGEGGGVGGEWFGGKGKGGSGGGRGMRVALLVEELEGRSLGGGGADCEPWVVRFFLRYVLVMGLT